MQKPNKSKKFLNSFKYAFAGIASALKTEKNLKVHILIMILVIIFGIIFKINITEWCICIILFGLVISLELVNTAIEIVVDMITLEKNEKAKKAKDISASAVLISSISSAIIGLIIFIPKLLTLLK